MINLSYVALSPALNSHNGGSVTGGHITWTYKSGSGQPGHDPQRAIRQRKEAVRDQMEAVSGEW
jgi:hypothetical protein